MRAIVALQQQPYTRALGTGSGMRFEVVEESGEWIVRRGGEELARFEDQEKALADVAARLREAEAGETASLSVRYQARSA